MMLQCSSEQRLRVIFIMKAVPDVSPVIRTESSKIQMLLCFIASNDRATEENTAAVRRERGGETQKKLLSFKILSQILSQDT